MRVPITDKFLWDLYNFIEEINEGFSIFSPRTMKEAIYPDLRKLRMKYEKRKNRERFSKLVYYLKKKGYIKIKNLQQEQAVLLTQKGMDKVLKFTLKMKDKRRRKDRKWQMIIFDIPERKRKIRDLFRENLKLLGYKELQQSVWVCSYEVYKETELLIRRYSIDPYVRLFLIEEIEI